MITINESLYVLENLVEGLDMITADSPDVPVICKQLLDIRKCISYLQHGLWMFGAEDEHVEELATSYIDPGDEYDPEKSIFHSEETWKRAKENYKSHCERCENIVQIYNLKNYLKLMEGCGDDNK